MSIELYKQKLEQEKANIPELSSLNSTSKVSIFRNLFYIVASTANDLSNLFKVHKKEVTDLINAQKITNEEYYRTVALEYRDGHTFDAGKQKYYGTYTPAQITSAMIIKRCAVQVITSAGRQKLFVKVATEDASGKLVPLPALQFQRFIAYMNLRKPLGVNIKYQSIAADQLRIVADVYIDPQILTENGDRIDGTINKPVELAFHEFFKDSNFKFDGELVLSLLENRVQKVVGVLDEAVRFENVESTYTGPNSWNLIKERYTANSGYFDLVSLKINYLKK